MQPRTTRVLIVDDSALIRRVLSMGLSSDPEIDVIATANSAEAAWEVMRRDRPDVITLDVEMPGVDGLTFLRHYLPSMPIPAVMISSLTRDGADVSMRALEAGAVDVISKPSLGLVAGLPTIMTDICARVRAAAGARVATGRTRHALPVTPASLPPEPRPEPRSEPRPEPRPEPRAEQPAAPATPPAIPHVPRHARPGATRAEMPATPVPAPQPRHMGGPTLLCIGSSTGGVQALSTILPCFPSETPPILIVQHMPEGFTGPFASRLDTICAMSVREAQDGDTAQPGQILVAPGGTRHMTVERHGRGYRVALRPGDPVCFSRPSVDVLFHSVALAAGSQAIGAILTGMGRDGATGLLAIRNAGGATLAQDEESSVVYGMPMAARDLGAAQSILPLEQIPARMLQAVTAPHAARV